MIPDPPAPPSEGSRRGHPAGRYRRLSAPGESALSIWRLAGPAASFRQLDLPGSAPVPRLVRIRGLEGQLLDEGLFRTLEEGAPGGEQLGELHLHGGGGVARAWTAVLRARGWSEQRGTDPERATLTGARSPLAARAACALLDGSFDRVLEDWLDQPPAERRAAARVWSLRLRWARWIEDPPRFVLAGPPNAGKSTLFNAWLEQERVTISPHPGTTRDAVRARLLLGPEASACEVELVDTAGLWEAGQAVDQAAVAASRAELARAFRVIWVLDAAASPGAAIRTELDRAEPEDLRLLHRDDLDPGGEASGAATLLRPDDLRGSVLRERAELVARLEAWCRAQLAPWPGEPPLLPLGEARSERIRSALAELGQA